ncbi:hypothetical protein BDY21DRAFT_378629 [Lineolata rhizophorae]|uniref:Uncharacterized protein n=1 Tax=Lineolata rhizophorae TaxID=578093 RepID=A0A6A6P2S3_9PEZI|nr:hypothetical protein BDY21DRAFT_378629 [Lineolata rhizophorae]
MRKANKANKVDSDHTQKPTELSWLQHNPREVVQRGRTLEDLQNAWNLCFALKNQPVLVCAGESPTFEELRHAYTQYKRMEESPYAIKVLSRAGRRYYLVRFYKSYKQKRLEAGEVPGKHSKVKAEFIAKMFPKDQKRQKHTQRDCQDPIRSFNCQIASK